MEIIKVKISDLHHPEKNPRKHSINQIKEMMRSVEKFGQYRPIIIDEENTILACNGLVMAMREMGIEEAEAVRFDNLTEAKKKQLMLADNQISSLGSDDMNIIEEIIRELDGDFDVPGFDEETLNMLVAESEAVTEEVLNYGTYTPEEVAGVKAHENEEYTPIKQTFEEPIQRVGMTDEKESDNTLITSPTGNGSVPTREVTETKREQYVVCPKCGETIWIE